MNACHGRWFPLAAVAALLLGALVLPAQGARTREFRLEGLGDVLAGELKGAGATASGAIFPAPPSSQLFAGEAAYVWGLVPDPQGGVHAATGSRGRVYDIQADGTWEVEAESFEYELFAFVEGPEGLYFAGAPNGTVMRLDAGRVLETLIDLPEGLVWSLIAGPEGDIFAASGENGEIYRIAPDGSAQSFAKIPDAHAVSFAWWGERLICGTDGRGLLLAIDPSGGEVRVLFDAPEEEIVALLVRGDRLLFAANGQNSEAEPEATGDVMVLPVFEVHADGSPAGAKLYEMRADGFVRQVWRCPEKRILSLAAAPGGGVLAGTGDQGVLFALDSLWNEVRLADFPEADLLCLAQAGSRVFVGTGNAGAVYRMDWDEKREGEYVSRVWDAEQVSSWGTPAWVTSGRGTALLESRSGQTGSPDEGWSAWEALSDGRIASPAGRFLQWRMTLGAEPGMDLQVGRVIVPYRGPNRAPEIVSLEVSPKAAESSGGAGAAAGPVRQELPGGVRVEYELAAEGEAVPEQGARPSLWARTLRTAAWKVRDPDGDALRYDVYLQFVGEEDFLPLKLDLEAPGWTWEAAAWPDGWYQLKLVARDEDANAPGEGLVAARVSEPFQIDNTPPLIEALRVTAEGEGWRLAGLARDAGSRIAAIEYSVDGEGWRAAISADGIVDGPVEDFSVLIGERGGRAPAVIGVRVADEAGHLATGRVRVPAE